MYLNLLLVAIWCPKAPTSLPCPVPTTRSYVVSTKCMAAMTPNTNACIRMHFPMNCIMTNNEQLPELLYTNDKQRTAWVNTEQQWTYCFTRIKNTAGAARAMDQHRFTTEKQINISNHISDHLKIVKCALLAWTPLLPCSARGRTSKSPSINRYQNLLHAANLSWPSRANPSGFFAAVAA